MIEVAQVLREVPGFDKFCSVQELWALAETLSVDTEFTVRRAGSSEQGRPIHHIRFGAGATKALFVGFPDANEPIGGLTAFSLLNLLAARHPALVGAGVQWHVVPCIDPDGAMLNEGWSQHPFELERYLRNFHRPAARDQVDCSFPITYKRLSFDSTTHEAGVLMDVIARVRPDFYYPLHNNSGTMGAWLLLSRDIGEPYYAHLHRLLADFAVPVQLSAPFGGQLPKYADGIYECPATRKLYDSLEKTMPAPEVLMRSGARSCDYAAEVNPAVLSFISELPYVKHPSCGSQRKTADALRRIKLEIDAQNKFLATVLLEEWAKVSGEVNAHTLFHRKVISDLVSVQDCLHEGLPCWPRKTRDTLFNPAYSDAASEGERFEAYMLERFFVLCHSYEFVRMLQASNRSPLIEESMQRLEREFTRALAQLDESVGFKDFQAFPLGDMAGAQLGCGLIALNSLLEARARS